MRVWGGGGYPLLWGPALALNPSAEREVVWVGVVVGWCGVGWCGVVGVLPFCTLDHVGTIFFKFLVL